MNENFSLKIKLGMKFQIERLCSVAVLKSQNDKCTEINIQCEYQNNWTATTNSSNFNCTANDSW